VAAVVAALVWLLIPLAALCAAVVWARWAARNRGAGDGASLAGYERFRQAMQASLPGTQAPAGDGDEDSPHGPFAGPVP
jgi:hypothetical protein